MKRMVMVVAAAMVTASIPALASVHVQGHDAQCARECQMLLRNCGQEVDSIQQRLSRLQGEIAKGTAVYSQTELKALEGRLQDVQQTLAVINAGG